MGKNAVVLMGKGREPIPIHKQRKWFVTRLLVRKGSVPIFFGGLDFFDRNELMEAREVSGKLPGTHGLLLDPSGVRSEARRPNA